MQKPLILVTNDDGINAAGLNALAEFVSEIGDVVVVAPDQPRSGQSHAITIEIPLKYQRLNRDSKYPLYTCNGTPVDAVKIAKNKILDRKPDLLVSGINHGSNSSVNIIYSGTVAAVLEGAMAGIPSVGFSLLDYSPFANFDFTKKYVQKIVNNVLDQGLPKDTALNVNFPYTNGQPLKGLKICRQAKAFWEEEFESRQDPHQREYFWLKGKFNNMDNGKDTDEWALANGYVSMVPIHYDFTAHHAIDKFKSWENYD
ncbi:MAG: 5'/3'-nucleotidase SurE [Bacteroidales bacterium]|nr:5'/3'-nucleotidase SurE [Bacteroidales bacterium]